MQAISKLNIHDQGTVEELLSEIALQYFLETLLSGLLLAEEGADIGQPLRRLHALHLTLCFCGSLVVPYSSSDRGPSIDLD